MLADLNADGRAAAALKKDEQLVVIPKLVVGGQSILINDKPMVNVTF